MRVTEGESKPWIPFDHVLLINEALMDVAAGRIRRLTVSMPPQHGKSEIISRFFTAWYMGTFPDRNVIQTMYEASLAHEYGGKARDIMLEFGDELFGVTVDSRSKARKAWHTWDTKRDKRFGGAMYTAGARGPITSRGADVLVIDDPIKGIGDALSSMMREQTFEWYQSVARSRIRRGGAIVLVQTRWHYDDLAGKVLKRAREGGEQWVELNLPALAEEDDPMGRDPEVALCEYLHPREELIVTRETTDPYWWNSMYQGRPSPKEGGIVERDWWCFYEVGDLERIRFDELIQSWDMSFERPGDKRSSQQGPDYVVGQTWGRVGAHGWLLGEVRVKANFGETIEAVQKMRKQWADTGLAELTSILVELKSAGPAIVWALQEKIPGIEGIKPVGSKEVRLHACTPMIRSKQVWLPDPSQKNYRWVGEWVEEWAQFPHGPNDDRVDAGTQALTRIRYRAALSADGEVESMVQQQESHWRGDHLK